MNTNFFAFSARTVLRRDLAAAVPGVAVSAVGAALADRIAGHRGTTIADLEEGRTSEGTNRPGDSAVAEVVLHLVVVETTMWVFGFFEVFVSEI